MLQKVELAKNQPVVETALAVTILLVSVIGAVVWGGGGYSAISAGQGNITGALSALLLQLACTWVQWTFANRVWSWPYVLSLAISTTTTVLGYFPIAAPVLYVWLIDRFALSATNTEWAVRVLVAVVAALADMVPERRLVR